MIEEAQQKVICHLLIPKRIVHKRILLLRNGKKKSVFAYLPIINLVENLSPTGYQQLETLGTWFAAEYFKKQRPGFIDGALVFFFLTSRKFV